MYIWYYYKSSSTSLENSTLHREILDQIRAQSTLGTRLEKNECPSYFNKCYRSPYSLDLIKAK